MIEEFEVTCPKGPTFRVDEVDENGEVMTQEVESDTYTIVLQSSSQGLILFFL